MNRSRAERLAAVTALGACALVCWLTGSAVGVVAAGTGTTRAELSGTAVERMAVTAGTWPTAPASSPSRTAEPSAAAHHLPPLHTATAMPTSTATRTATASSSTSPAPSSSASTS